MADEQPPPAPGSGGAPCPDELARSRRLRRRIADAIAAAGGAIPFSAFMDHALYAPGLGYYRAGVSGFGPEGDFVTAPELSPLFAACLARQLGEIFARGVEPEIWEFGPGSGRLAAELIEQLASVGAAPRRYALVELSAALAARQRERLAPLAERHGVMVEWWQRLPDTPQRGVFIANEVVDAIPCERFVMEGRRADALHVACPGDRAFTERGVADPALAAEVARIEARIGRRLPSGYRSELRPAGRGWLRTLGECLERGVMLIADYGYEQAELYHPQRTDGTLRCYFRHRVHDDPFVNVGLQDITAGVDFTDLAHAAAEVRLDLCGYTTQAWFLIGNGLTEMLETGEWRDAATRYRAIGEAKRLVLPGEMGERVKVLALGRGFEGPMSGFGERDLRGRL